MARSLLEPPVSAKPCPHFCHAEGCSKEIPPDVFFCAGHFELLPQKLRQEVSSVQPKGVNWMRRVGTEWSSVVDKARNWLRKNLLADVE